MSRFSRISIKGKLLLLALLTSGIAILFASTIFITAEMMFTRRALVQELSTTAEIIGANSTAAIVFDDGPAAEEILRALKTKPNVLGASIVTPDGNVLAKYGAPRGAGAAPSDGPHEPIAALALAPESECDSK